MLNSLSFVEFLRSNYSIILKIVTAVMVVALIVISFFKEKKSIKKNNILIKENDLSKFTKRYSLNYVITRCNIQDYYFTLYDEEGNETLKSQIYTSALVCRTMIEILKKSFNNSNYQIEKSDNLKFISLRHNKKIIALTKKIEESEINNFIDKLKNIINSPVYKGIEKDDQLEKADLAIESTKIKIGASIEYSDDKYYANILINKNEFFKTFNYDDKKSLKDVIDIIEKKIKRKDYYISQTENNKYNIFIYDRKKGILCKSKEYKSSRECLKQIKQLYE